MLIPKVDQKNLLYLIQILFRAKYEFMKLLSGRIIVWANLARAKSSPEKI